MKAKSFILAGLAGLLLAACTEDGALEQMAPQRYNSCLKVEVTDEFAAAATRANYSGFPATTFETGDAIGVYAFDGSSYAASNIRFVKQSDGSWLPDEDIIYNNSYTYYAYFPYRATTYTPSTSGTVDAVDTKFGSFISDASNYFWQADQSTKAGYTYSNLMIAKGTVTNVTAAAATVRFTMAHKRGLAVFNGENGMYATFTGNVPYLLGSTKQFLMKPSASTSFTDFEGTFSLSAPSGKYVSHSIDAIDLSMVDNSGSKRASMTTANCYLIHAAGIYKIPLVYGNAIKNGADNRVAYYPGESGSITNGTDQFVNHAGTSISGPWITKSTSNSGINKGMGLIARSAELLWQDASGLISAVSVEKDYLRFTVGTFAGGNALIAVKDGSGTILWSWHIWATTETLASTTTVATGSHNYAVAPVNLGWVPTGGEGKQGYCPYYQWGRKDPFIPCNGTTNGNTNKTVYNISGTTITGIANSQTNVTIADNIKNPTTFYQSKSESGPVSTVYYNMWDALCTTVGDANMSNATKKTIYDPCPPGFCVPTGNLFYYMGGGATQRLDSNWDSANLGKTWTLNGANIYFPFCGIRIRGNTNLLMVGTDSFCWGASRQANTVAYNLNSTSTKWEYNYAFPAHGMTVRPVVEE